METRKEEKFKVQKANTDRLKNSAIIYMQNLLNMQEEDWNWTRYLLINLLEDEFLCTF